MTIDNAQFIADLSVQAAKANRIYTDTPAVLHNGNIVSLEKLNNFRSRFRGAFGTSVLSEFAAYLKANPGGVGFIDPKMCTAKMFLNLGTPGLPGHADWTATLWLDNTAAFAAVLAIDGRQQSQRSLVEWMEDWSGNLRQVDGGSISGVVSLVRALTIKSNSEVTHTDKDFGAKKSALEEIEARSTSAIPTHVNFRCAPHVGFQDRDFPLRLSIITGEKPALVLRIVSKEALFEEIANEFKDLLIKAVGDAASMTIGSFDPK
jgi:uncharacterized protein YfdQ (DUF2303 family)